MKALVSIELDLANVPFELCTTEISCPQSQNHPHHHHHHKKQHRQADSTDKQSDTHSVVLFVVTCTRRTLGSTHLCNVRVHARIINIYIYIFTFTFYSLVFIIVSKLVAAIWYAQQLN